MGSWWWFQYNTHSSVTVGQTDMSTDTHTSTAQCKTIHNDYSKVSICKFFSGIFCLRSIGRKLSHILYRVAQKIGTIILYALTLQNINRFAKLFHYQNQEKIFNN